MSRKIIARTPKHPDPSVDAEIWCAELDEYLKKHPEVQRKIDEAGNAALSRLKEYCYRKYIPIMRGQANRQKKIGDDIVKTWQFTAEQYWNGPRHRNASVNEVAKHVKAKHGGALRTITEYIKSKRPQ